MSDHFKITEKPNHSLGRTSFVITSAGGVTEAVVHGEDRRSLADRLCSELNGGKGPNGDLWPTMIDLGKVADALSHGRVFYDPSGKEVVAMDADWHAILRSVFGGNAPSHIGVNLTDDPPMTPEDASCPILANAPAHYSYWEKRVWRKGVQDARQQVIQADLNDLPSGIEEVSVSLGDDAALLLDANPEDEMGENMKRAAAMLDFFMGKITAVKL